MDRFCVMWYDANGKFKGVVSGMGRNKGKWEGSCETRRTAQRWAQQLRKQFPNDKFVIEPTV